MAAHGQDDQVGSPRVHDGVFHVVIARDGPDGTEHVLHELLSIHEGSKAEQTPETLKARVPSLALSRKYRAGKNKENRFHCSPVVKPLLTT